MPVTIYKKAAVLGDIHGMSDKLAALMAHPSMAGRDLFVQWFNLGIVDRNVRSRLMGGQATLDSFGNRPENVSQAHRDLIERLNLTMVLEHEDTGRKHRLIHAGLPPEAVLVPFEDRIAWAEKNAVESLLWGGFSQASMPPIPEKLIVGHIPRTVPMIRDHWIGMDTGCGMGGKLSALLLPEEKTISV